MLRNRKIIKYHPYQDIEKEHQLLSPATDDGLDPYVNLFDTNINPDTWFNIDKMGLNESIVSEGTYSERYYKLVADAKKIWSQYNQSLFMFLASTHDLTGLHSSKDIKQKFGATGDVLIKPFRIRLYNTESSTKSQGDAGKKHGDQYEYEKGNTFREIMKRISKSVSNPRNISRGVLLKTKLDSNTSHSFVISMLDPVRIACEREVYNYPNYSGSQYTIIDGKTMGIIMNSPSTDVAAINLSFNACHGVTGYSLNNCIDCKKFKYIKPVFFDVMDANGNRTPIHSTCASVGSSYRSNWTREQLRENMQIDMPEISGIINMMIHTDSFKFNVPINTNAIKRLISENIGCSEFVRRNIPIYF